MSTPQQPWPSQPPQQQPQPWPAPPQQQQQRQPLPPGPTGELVIDLLKPVGAMGMISPVVTIDGYPAASSWGRNSFVVPAGTRRVDVAQTYLWTYGRATLPVQVAPGASVDVFYAGPMATFMGGAIGTQPQKRPAQAFFVGILVLVGVLLMIGVLAAVLGNA